MSQSRQSRVLMIGLDAAEPRLVEQWMDEGSLPHLRSLRARGGYGRLASSADWLAGSPWPTFYTGRMPPDHGLYHYLQWRADLMALVRPSPDWLKVRPFWRDLSEAGRHVVAIDVPMTFPPEPFNGVEICGWAGHDQLGPPSSYPPGELDWIRRQFGPSPLGPEVYGLQRPKSLLQLRDELIRATDRVADVAKVLMHREEWDLFLVGFGATHRGGHKLWDLSGALGEARPSQRTEFSHALKDVYVACDAAVGKLLETAGESVDILVFSLHGMGPNACRVDMLPAMLDCVLSNGGASQGSKKSYLQRLPELIPLAWRQGIKRRLSASLLDRLTTFLKMGRIDWAATPAFSLVADLQGYIRVNLRGREVAGIVEPGEEYDLLCAKIAEGLGTFVDAETNQPIVESVKQRDQIFPPGPRANDLPDLLVRWDTSSSPNHRAIVSSRWGSISWPAQGRHPSGRSGNHRPEGFLLAVGDRFKPDSRIKNAHIVQLAPTVYSMLSISKPAAMDGNVLASVQPG